MVKVHQIGIRVDAETKAAIEAAARADDRTVSALILRIIKEWLAEHEPPKKGKKK